MQVHEGEVVQAQPMDEAIMADEHIIHEGGSSCDGSCGGSCSGGCASCGHEGYCKPATRLEDSVSACHHMVGCMLNICCGGKAV